MGNLFGKIKKFLNETIAELHKCSWTPKSELFESTILVIVAVVVLGTFVAGVDEVSRLIISFLTTGGV